MSRYFVCRPCRQEYDAGKRNDIGYTDLRVPGTWLYEIPQRMNGILESGEEGVCTMHFRQVRETIEAMQQHERR